MRRAFFVGYSASYMPFVYGSLPDTAFSDIFCSAAISATVIPAACIRDSSVWIAPMVSRILRTLGEEMPSRFAISRLHQEFS